MRFLLVTWLALGLAPGFGEVVESAVHYVTAGHLAHSDADHGDLADQGDEHGCGTTEHRCSCCVSQAVAPPPVTTVLGLATGMSGLPPTGASLSSLHDPAPPYRPPIAS
jgi:hypothetical protein